MKKLAIAVLVVVLAFLGEKGARAQSATNIGFVCDPPTAFTDGTPLNPTNDLLGYDWFYSNVSSNGPFNSAGRFTDTNGPTLTLSLGQTYWITCRALNLTTNGSALADCLRIMEFKIPKPPKPGRK